MKSTRQQMKATKICSRINNSNEKSLTWFSKVGCLQSSLIPWFYNVKPLIPRRLQIYIRRKCALYIRDKFAHVWPINPEAGNAPPGWTGWPNGKKFAVVLTHDVDTQNGHDKLLNLLNIEEDLGFKSTFNFVPERYKNSNSLHKDILDKGFEIAVHGLKHDGKLFKSRDIFENRAKKINDYLDKWNTKGFTSPSMHHNLNWMTALNIEYSISTFDTDPFEPQPDGVNTIFPFQFQASPGSKSFVELPYTLPQDFTLFIMLREKNNQIWKRKLDWIAENGGMALLNTHSDYMNFGVKSCRLEEYPVKFYIDFLNYIKEKYQTKYWQALPSEMANYIKSIWLSGSLK